MKKKFFPKITKIGSGKPSIGIVCQIHGNETSTSIVEKLIKNLKLDMGTVYFIYANPYAFSKKKRFLDTDLNRIFPGKAKGNTEEQLANELLKIGEKCNYLLDLHTCSMESEPFCIVRYASGKQMQLAQQTGLKNIVVYPKNTQMGGSFIDYVSCGIGLELGLHERKSTIIAGYNAVINVLMQLEMVKKRNNPISVKSRIFYKVVKHLANINTFRPIPLMNFKLVKEGDIIGENKKMKRRAQQSFYPIMYQQQSYKKILCWVAERFS